MLKSKKYRPFISYELDWAIPEKKQTGGLTITAVQII